jgi:hypothetical protein
MLMRFHWGLGVGHLYSHDNGEPTQAPTSRRDDAQQAPEPATPRQQTPDEEELTNGDDLNIVREAEAELNLDLRQLSPEDGELPEFLRDDDDELVEDVDENHQRTVFG